LKYALKRILYVLVVIIAVTFLVSALVRFLPGDAAAAILGENATPEQLRDVREDLGLNQGVVEYYFTWLGNAVQGDFGTSLRTGQPVMEAITERLPVSIELVILAQILALLFAIPAAVYAAYRSNGWFDRTSRIVSSFLISLPNFLIALVAVEILAVKFNWLPSTGYKPLADGLFNNLKWMILPAIAIAAEPAGVYQRIFRTDMGTTLNENYIAFARSKGLSPSYVLRRHAIRPSTFSLMTLAGINTAKLIGGTLVVETIFSLPGIGRLLIDGIVGRDLPMVSGVIAVITLAYVFINAGVDLLYGAIDPRVRDAAR
jgi:peptide/nickel transport system permease protein